MTFKTQDGTTLHGLLFQVDKPKGLIFYLHGNTGAADRWGLIAQTYTAFQYDFFILDYRGYGKSEGRIQNEEQFYNDLQTVYHAIKPDYGEENIVIVGYSIGSGPAAMLAAHNHPKLLILKAPYYSLVDIARNTFPVFPSFLLKYKFRTYEFVQKTKVPIVIFHGERDEIIPYRSALKLKPYLKPEDVLILIKGQGHLGINEKEEYRNVLRNLL